MPEPIRILELRSVRGTGGGPEKTILASASLSEPDRYAVTVCYVRDQRDDVFAIDRRAAVLGIDYVEILERHSFDFSIWPALRQLVQSRRIEIVHSHDYKTNLYAWLLGKAEPIVPLATLHGYTGNSMREQFYYAVDKRLVSWFPALIAVSEDLRAEVIRAGARPERICRILNGIDHHAFRRDESRRPHARAALALNSSDIVIGAVGRLERQKRFDLLIQAFHAIVRRNPTRPLRLIIAGDGSLRRELELERDRLDPGMVRLLGHQQDVTLLHDALDVFVQSSDYEGTPNAVLEAMALETPLVATAVGGTTELVTPDVHGVIVPSGECEALATGIERVLADPDAARRRTLAARQRVEHELSFRARMSRIEGVYDTLAATKRGAGPVRLAAPSS